MIQITAQVGDHLRWEEDGAHGGYEEDLGLHQEEQPQSGSPPKLEWICSNFTRVLTYENLASIQPRTGLSKYASN